MTKVVRCEMDSHDRNECEHAHFPSAGTMRCHIMAITVMCFVGLTAAPQAVLRSEIDM